MKLIKKHLLSIINIIIPIILLVILLFSKLNENIMYLMMITVLIGWIIPYFVLIITGLSLIKNNKPKLTLIFNVVNIFLTIMIFIFLIRLYDKTFLIMVISYVIIFIISIINTIYILNYIKKNPNPENIEIKKIKKNNNGAIV